MKLKPLNNYVVIEPIAPESETKEGIIIAKTAQSIPVTGIVLAVGPKVTTLKVNDEVYYPQFAGTEVVVDDRSYLMLFENEVLAIISRGDGVGSEEPVIQPQA